MGMIIGGYWINLNNFENIEPGILSILAQSVIIYIHLVKKKNIFSFYLLKMP